MADAAVVDAGGPADDAGEPDASLPDCETYWALYTAEQDVEFSAELFARRIAGGPVDGPFQVNPELPSSDRVRDSSRPPVVPAPLGERVAFVIQRQNPGREIWVADLAGPTPGEPMRVSGVPVEGGGVLPYSDDASISWSPDGSKIAYVADQNVDGVIELFVVDMSGAEPGVAQRVNAPPTSTDMHVAATESDFLWSPDSTRIAYRANHEDVDTYEIFAVDVSGASPGDPIKINGAVADGTDVEDFFAWNADGSGVLYIASPSAGSERIYLARLSGGEVTERIELSPPGAYAGAVMAPSGDAFVYRGGGAVRLVELQPSPSSPESISGILDVAGGDPLWSPDSTKIAFEGHGADSGLYVADRANGAGQEPTEVSGELGDSGFITDYSWTPESDGVVYTAKQEGGDGWLDLYLGNPNGGAPVTLFETTGGVELGTYRLSPEGKMAAFLANLDEDNVVELYGIEVGPQTPTPFKINDELTPGYPDIRGDVVDFAWSPEGRKLIYLADQDVDDRVEAYVAPISGSGAGSPVKLNGAFDVEGQVWHIGWGACAE